MTAVGPAEIVTPAVGCETDAVQTPLAKLNNQVASTGLTGSPGTPRGVLDLRRSCGSSGIAQAPGRTKDMSMAARNHPGIIEAP